MGKICMFCGHRVVEDKEYIINEVTNKAEYLINNENVDIFYLGGKGEFDELCAHSLKTLKLKYPHISLQLIIPYKTKDMTVNYQYYADLYDKIYKPYLGYGNIKTAIPKRNRWMVDKSDFVVAYIRRSTGGAYTTLMYANSKNKAIINI